MPTIYTSGTLARAAGLSVETIRNFEKRGILKPQRDQTNRRIYTDLDLVLIHTHRQARGDKRHEKGEPR
ncbi:MAG: MerR family transcriptional regulator [bacterium]|nr:MerR family transcriptional regulator [bacterium]